MTDQESVLESAADADTQSRAEAMGWIPPAKFKGDPERYVDADKFLERGETVLPIVKKQLADTRAELDAFKREADKTAVALRSLQESQREADVRNAVEKQRAVEQAIKDTKVALGKASEAGDHEAVAELTDDLVELRADKKAVDAEVKAPPAKEKEAPAVYVPPAELAEWNVENPWFGKDKRKTALALGIAQDLRDQGETKQGRAFFDLVGKEMRKELRSEGPLDDKVEGARNGAEGEGRSGGRKTYQHLPADAKAACDADVRNFVGPNKQYKTPAEWRSRYAELYFKEG